MRRLRGGRIINFSDWTARSGRPRYTGYLPYYVAKAGVVALTEALALELASDQILVNAIAPGPIVAPEGASDEEFAAVERATPLGRWGGEAEIAKAVLALVDTDFITGETIRVDGGRHLSEGLDSDLRHDRSRAPATASCIGRLQMQMCRTPSESSERMVRAHTSTGVAPWSRIPRSDPEPERA